MRHTLFTILSGAQAIWYTGCREYFSQRGSGMGWEKKGQMSEKFTPGVGKSRKKSWNVAFPKFQIHEKTPPFLSFIFRTREKDLRTIILRVFSHKKINKTKKKKWESRLHHLYTQRGIMQKDTIFMWEQKY